MEESDTKVRRTRSGKVKSTPPPKVTKSSKSSPKGEAKPGGRKTRKKVVLMEVEVSEEEEETPVENSGDEKNELNENELEDKLLASPEPVTNDASEEKSFETTEQKELNGGDNVIEEEKNVLDDSITVVFNDIESLETEDDEHNVTPNDKKDTETVEQETNLECTTKKPTGDTETVKFNENEKEEILATAAIKETVKVEEKKPATLVVELEKLTETEKKLEKVEAEKDNETEEVEDKKNKDVEKETCNVETDKETSAIEKVEPEKMEVDEKCSEKATKSSEEEPIEKMDIDLDTSTQEEKKDEKVDDKSTTNKEIEEERNNKEQKQNGDPDAENISEDELPGVPVVKVPEAEEVSDEELPGPKRAELPADTEVVSEDELPTVKTEEKKKEGTKRKINETDDYDPGSPTSESEAPTKKPSLEKESTEKEEKPKPKKLPELDKYWKAVNDDPTDFTGWTYLLQYVDQENDMEAAREAYDAFLSHYPYCYGYWRKYADYEKRKGNKKKCEEVFERGLKAIPLSVDLWIHYLTYVKSTRADEEDFIRSQFDRALAACGLEFRSDRLWDSYIKWETEGKRLQKVTGIYDKLLATPTQGYTTHFDNFQEHVASNPPNKVIDVDEFLALRKEVRNVLKHDNPPEVDSDAPPGDDDQSKVISTDEETKSIRERIVSIRRKIHKGTVNAVTSRWNYEEGIKRPYFHVKPLERCQLKNWHDYLDYETEQGDRVRIIVLFERCLIACALYEEFWLKFVHYLEDMKDPELQPKIRDVYERACTIHHLKKPNLHLQWAMFEENVNNSARAAEILVNLEKTVPNVLQIAYRRINLERRRQDHEKCTQLYEHYISNSKNKMISSNIAIKFSRFCFRILKDVAKAQEVLKTAITKDPNNPRLYLQLIDLTLQKDDVTEKEVIDIIDSFLEKESTEIDQKSLFAQRKLEYLEDFGSDIQSVQLAHDNYQKLLKMSKESNKKKEIKSDTSSSTAKKEKPAATSAAQASTYNYGQYGANPSQPPYGYSGQQGQYNYSQYGQNEQYQYQNWQYPQGSYGGYNQWGGYSGGYGY